MQQNPAFFKLLKRLDKETNGKWVVEGNPLHHPAKQPHGLLVEISSLGSDVPKRQKSFTLGRPRWDF